MGTDRQTFAHTDRLARRGARLGAWASCLLLIASLGLVVPLATPAGAKGVGAARRGSEPRPASLASSSSSVGTITSITDIDQPTAITTGPDGNLWFTNVGNNTIGRSTTIGAVKDFTDPTISDPRAITAGPDGNVWFTNYNNNSIGRITPSGTVTNYTNSTINHPQGIVAGSDGNLWFTNTGSNSIGRITTSGSVSNYTDSSIDNPTAILSGPDGNLWFANAGGLGASSIGRITTAGVVTSYALSYFDEPEGLPCLTAGPGGKIWLISDGDLISVTTAGVVTTVSSTVFGSEITAGPDGALWVVDFGDVKRVTTAGVVTNTFSDPAEVSDLVAGPDGALWITGAAGVGTIGRITVGGAETNYPGMSSTETVTSGPDGALWYTDNGDESPPTIGRITTTGVVTRFVDPHIAQPRGLVVGPDGALWFTQPGSIGRITTAGVITHFDNGAIGGEGQIVNGPDGALWFANGGSIGRITTAGSITLYTDPSVETENLTVGPDGALWFANGSPFSIGRITTAGVITHIPITDESLACPAGITAGPDGALWFIATGCGDPGSIGRITTAGTMTHYDANDLDHPYAINVGPDGNLWYTTISGIGRITTAGTATNYPITGDELRDPFSIAPGPDGAMWFTTGQGSVRRITTTATASASQSTVSANPTSLPANGLASATITVTLEDSGGAPVPGKSVRLTQGAGGHSTISASSGLSGASGQVTFSVTDATPEAVTYAATDTTDSATLSQTATVTFTPGVHFHALPPARVLDSRPGAGNVGGYTSPWSTGTVRTVAVGGHGGVPSNADSVVLNVTVADTSSSSYLTVWPTGSSQPTASDLNWVAGEVIPNAVTVKLGTSGEVSVFNQAGAADVIIDVAGYYDSNTGDGFSSLTPARVLDSRRGAGNTGGYSSPWSTGTVRTVAVGGHGAVPSNADAVVLNVTVADTTESSYLSAWPTGSTQPTASSLNWVAGEVIPNAVTVKLGINGDVSVFNNSGNADVIIDVAGYYQAGTGKLFHSLTPARILDSRPGAGDTGGYSSPWGTNTTRTVAVGGLVGVPAAADSVVMNVTVADTTGSSYLTLWPNGQTQPTASNLNWVAGEVVPNAVTVELGTTGHLSVANFNGNVDVIADVAGYFG